MIEEFKYNLNDFLTLSKSNPEQLYFLDFMAQWCGPCKKIKPFIHELVDEFPIVKFFIIDTDEDEMQELVEYYDISALPTFLLIKNGEVMRKVLGIEENDIMEAINNSL